MVIQVDSQSRAPGSGVESSCDDREKSRATSLRMSTHLTHDALICLIDLAQTAHNATSQGISVAMKKS